MAERERLTKEEEVAQAPRAGRTLVPPFVIVADHPRNCDLLLQCIPGCRLRSALSASKPVIDQKTGEAKIPVDQARHLGQLPQVPGMHLAVNPAELTYEITDPLFGDEEACERLRRAINETGGATRIPGKLKGVKPNKGTLDIHRMKS